MTKKSLRSAVVISGPLVGVALAVAVVCRAGEEPHPNTIPVTTQIDVDVSTSGLVPSIAVKPPAAVILAGDPVTWVVQGLTHGMQLEIDFHVGGTPSHPKKGPFPPKPGGKDPRGRYTFDADGKQPTEKSDGGKETFWKYDVILRQNGKDVAVEDPMIILK